jgi:hypothetical protein
MKSFYVFLLVLFLVIGFCVIPINPVHSADDSWIQKASMPTARSALGVAVVNGKIFAIGGYNASYLTKNEEYDPATDTWTTKQPMPTPRSSFGIAVCQNKIYVIGGASGNSIMEVVTDVNEVYDPATDSWSQKTKIPLAGEQFQANVLNGKIYLTGGLVSTDTQIYDPSTDTWSSGAPIPTQVYSYGSTVANGKMYVLGGFSQTSNLNQIYNPQSNTWSTGRVVPTPVIGETAAVTTGTNAPEKIYIIGGRVSSSTTANSVNQVYDPATDQWTSGSDMPTARFNFGVALVDDLLYAIGGVASSSHTAAPYNTNEQYTPIGYGTVSSASPSGSVAPTSTIGQGLGGGQLGVILAAVAVVILAVVVVLIFVIRNRQNPKSIAPK